jgi:hypothetical protein
MKNQKPENDLKYLSLFAFDLIFSQLTLNFVPECWRRCNGLRRGSREVPPLLTFSSTTHLEFALRDHLKMNNECQNNHFVGCSRNIDDMR